jgi:D-sedoheptulose 7-phosphate isomerase
MDIRKYYATELAEHHQVLSDTTDQVTEAFVRLVDVACASVKRGGKLLFFGNGGSAADAQHIATELTVRYLHNRRAIPAIALTTDSSALTAIGNDFGFDELFARQVEALARPEDVAVGISTSGNSVNVVKALETTQRIGATAAALTGCGGGKIRDIADPVVIVPSDKTSRIQEMHIIIGHMLCGAIEQQLGLIEE